MRTSPHGLALRSTFLALVLLGGLPPAPARAARPNRSVLEEAKSRPTVDVGPALGALIEADWIGRDRRSGRREAFSLAHTRQVVDNAGRLAARLAPRAEPKRLGPLVARLGEMEKRLARLEAADEVPQKVRKEIHFDARRAARDIAFSNPLLDFDKILFLKRHDSVGVYHMCDQYYEIGRAHV